LYLMKIDRNDPKCPRGILWTTKDELPKYAEVKWNGIPATNAITKKYRVYLTAHKIGNRRLHLESFTASATLDCLLFTVVPFWFDRNVALSDPEEAKNEAWRLPEDMRICR